jgi:hypothetical protein
VDVQSHHVSGTDARLGCTATSTLAPARPAREWFSPKWLLSLGMPMVLLKTCPQAESVGFNKDSITIMHVSVAHCFFA